MKKTHSLAAACVLACTSVPVLADSSVTLYGDIDIYGNYMKSSSGVHLISLEDGAYLISAAATPRPSASRAASTPTTALPP